MERKRYYPALRSVTEIERDQAEANRIDVGFSAGKATEPQHLFTFVLPVATLVGMLGYYGLHWMFPLDHPYEPVSGSVSPPAAMNHPGPDRGTYPPESETHYPRVPEVSSQAGGGSPVPQSAYDLVTVGPGDTLSSIARRIYGRSSQYDELYEFNQDTLENPDTLKLGQQIRVPR